VVQIKRVASHGPEQEDKDDDVELEKTMRRRQKNGNDEEL
jgi:hypothetical protein